jgi:hypothetical protein
MRPRHLLLALPLFALLSPTARMASATPPDTQKAAPPPPARTEAQRPIEKGAAAEADAAAVVEKQLVKPLTQKEAKQDRFSRSYIPPQARRVRILDERSTDGRGAAFVAFAVDARSRLLRKADDDSGWRKDAIVGCVYPARDEVFIKRGDKFFGAGLLLGQRTAAADDAVCRPGPTRVPSSPPTLASTSQVVPGSRSGK